jgi:hypothetical protein
MKAKTPAANGRGMETLTGNFLAPITLASYHAQLIAARYALPFETAALVAAMAWGA